MIRHRALTAIALATLVAAPLAACTGGGTDEDPTTATTSQAAPSANPADATPQERVEAYLKASDAAAAEGWKDSSYSDEYLVPDLAAKVKDEDAKNAESGAVVGGDRKLSDWTVTEETDTTATVEFCDDTTGLSATKDGQPYQINNQSQSVGQYKLTRATASDPWLISQQGYYEEGTTCAEHFAG